MIRKASCILILISPLIITPSYSQTLNINELHVNNASGVPVLLDQVVSITGEVTVSNQFDAAANVEDPIGVVVVYDGVFATTVNVGDFVTISGRVTQFNGLTELDEAAILNHTPQIPSIEPQLVTCQDIQAEGSGGIENLEGELIRLNNVNVNTNNFGELVSGGVYFYCLYINGLTKNIQTKKMIYLP